MKTPRNLPGTSNPLDLLLVEDNAGDARLVTEYLATGLDRGYQLTHASTLTDALSSMQTRHPDLVLLDLGLPDSAGVQNVRKLHSVNGRSPIVVLTGLEDESVALEALKEGAQDYLIKDDLNAAVLSRSIRYSLERDLTSRALERAREKAKNEKAFCRSILRSLGDHIAVLDGEGTILAANEAWKRFSRENRGVLRGREGENYLQAADSSSEPEAAAMIDGIRSVLTGDRQAFTRVYPCHAPDSELWFRASVVPLEGAEAGVVISHTDVTGQKRLEEDLRHRALHDDLTGLPNRTLLMDRIAAAMSWTRRRDESLGLMIMDIDRFKQINDSLGHTAGDRVLEAVARRLNEAVREEDTVGRWGGDEFILVLPGASGPDGMEALRRRIQRALREPYAVAGSQLSLDASVGAVLRSSDNSCWGVVTNEPEELVQYADTALLDAKEGRRGGYVLFDPEGHVRIGEILRREQDLRRGLAAGEFVPFYQPIVRLDDGTIWGVEPLARWLHPERGLVEPGEFIPLAEETGLIVDLGRSVLRQSLEQVARWDREGVGPELRVSPNMSGRQMEDEGLVDQIRDTLETTGIAPSRLQLEVTETSLMRAANRVAELRSLGTRIWIDDFGTGYSSYLYLRDLDVDGLKIDMSFVQGLGRQRGNQAIVGSIITLGREMGLHVVAEGIETPDQLGELRLKGCGLGQGYLFTRPLPAHEMTELLRRGAGRVDLDS